MLPRIAMSGITKRFGAVEALADVDFDLLPGEVHGLLGENGAGKSTLMRLLAGEMVPGSGKIHIEGRPVRLRSPAAAAAHGIAMVHQHFTLIDNLTVRENLALVSPRGCRGRRNAVAGALAA